MKSFNTLFSLFLCLSIPLGVFSQVGIGTITPLADLHVAGEFLVQTQANVAAFDAVSNTDEDFQLIMRTRNSVPSGELKILDTEQVTVAPVNVFEYEFINVSSDNVTDVDLQFDSSRYVVTISNFRHIGDPIAKRLTAGRGEIGYFVYRTFEDVNTGTWHIEIRNRILDLNPGDQVSYRVTLTVYDTRFFKKLPLITSNLNGNNSGTATDVPIFN